MGVQRVNQSVFFFFTVMLSTCALPQSCHRGTNRRPYSSLADLSDQYSLQLIYVLDHSAPLALMYSIISTVFKKKRGNEAFSPPARFKLGHGKGHFSLHKCSFHAMPVIQHILKQSSFSCKLMTLSSLHVNRKRAFDY